MNGFGASGRVLNAGKQLLRGTQLNKRSITVSDLKALAQRLREYNSSPHHVDPMSEAFHSLVLEAAQTISALADSKIDESILDTAYWDFDARVKGYAPYEVPSGNPVWAFKAAIYAALDNKKPS